MELEQQQESISNEEKTKDWLEALLFDLSLFQDAPILAFDADMVEDEFRKLGAIYYEHRNAIELIIGRLVELDMKKLFATGVYHEPRVKELSIDGIYQAFFPGTSRSFKEQGSYAMYLIYQAVQSIFCQVLGKSTRA